MKRLVHACLTLVLASFASSAAVRADWLVGFAQDHLANDWRAAQAREIREELERHPGVRFLLTDAKGSTAQQVADMEDLVARGVDLLIVSPRDGRVMAPAVASIHGRGVPVVLVTRMVTGEGYTAFVGGDDRGIGREAARFLARRLGGAGRVLVLQGVPSATTAQERTRGFLEGIRDIPGLSIAVLRSADYLRANAASVVEEVLEARIPFDAVFAQSDSMATGARLALRKAGIDPASKPTVGVDYIREARDAIRAGEQEASFTYPTLGKEAAELALRILAGERVPKETVVPSIRVDRGNVDRVEPIF
jgi:ribose transport system substrate-binding protein